MSIVTYELATGAIIAVRRGVDPRDATQDAADENAIHRAHTDGLITLALPTR